MAPTLDSEFTGRAIAGMDEQTKRTLLDEGLLRQTRFGGDTVWSEHLAPNWSLKTTYYWTQTFPASEPITIEHRYAPSLGRSLDTVFNYDVTPDQLARMRSTYCVDDEFLSAVENRGDDSYTETIMGYVLTTGGNWAGPIGEFALTVRKDHERELISFCGKDRSERIDPTTYRLERTDYVPQSDLSVLILRPLGLAR